MIAIEDNQRWDFIIYGNRALLSLPPLLVAPSGAISKLLVNYGRTDGRTFHSKQRLHQPYYILAIPPTQYPLDIELYLALIL